MAGNRWPPPNQTHTGTQGGIITIQELLHPTATRIRDLIEAERARPLETTAVALTIGSTETELVFTELRGHEWGEVARSPARLGHLDDFRFGVNIDRVIESYPVERVQIGGQTPTADEWAQLVSLFDPATRADLVTAIWWNQFGVHAKNETRVNDASEERP